MYIMKNILLATTGLFGAAMLATAAGAATPKVTLGGFTDFQVGITDDDRDTNIRGTGFRNDTEIQVRVDGKTDGGLGYGAVIDIEADVTNDANNEGTNASRTFTYLSGNWGKVELGSNGGAETTLRTDASTLAVATGGINGSWVFFANGAGAGAGNLGNAANGGFITGARGFVEHGSTTALDDETFENATKITYYTPRYSGFQFGVSYTPDIDDRGQTVGRTETGTSFGDVWSGGVNYEGKLTNDVTFAASLTGEFGDGDANGANTNNDIEAYAIGALVGFKQFSLAGSWGDWSDSLGNASTAGDDATYWTLGAGYEAGPVGLSVTYLSSEVERAAAQNEFDNVVFSADYKLAPGLTPYAEVAIFEFDEEGTTGYDNEGTVFLLGTQVAF
jgi:hypothetical protein